jgi:hypothetical protein
MFQIFVDVEAFDITCAEGKALVGSRKYGYKCEDNIKKYLNEVGCVGRNILVGSFK